MSTSKIAVVRRDGLGDLLCAYPLINFLKKERPYCSITLFVGADNASLVPYLPAVDEVVVLPKKGNKYLNLFKVARRYYRQFDQVYIAKTSPMKLMNVFLWWLKPKEGFAYVDRSWHARFVNHPQFATVEKIHQALRSLHMVDPTLQEVPEALYPTIKLPTAPSSSKKPKLLISASTTREASRFPVERYAGLVNRLSKNYSFDVELLTLPTDYHRAEALERLIDSSCHIAQPTEFEDFISVLGACTWFFVGDGGVAHLAAALDKPALVLFGETDPIEWHPLSKKGVTVYHPDHVKYLDDEEVYTLLESICGKNL